MKNFLSNLRRRKMLSRKFQRNQSGAAAVEFSIIAPLFLMMMFSLFEVGWFYFAGSVVDASVADAARLVRTGQVQQSAGSATDKYDIIFDEICDVVSNFGDCDERLTVEVQKYTDFATLAADLSEMTCASATPSEVASIPFDPGEDLEIIRVRICYLYNTINPAIGINLADPGTGQRKLISTMIFRNEPYSKNSPTS